jgi:hypothetical protein
MRRVLECLIRVKTANRILLFSFILMLIFCSLPISTTVAAEAPVDQPDEEPVNDGEETNEDSRGTRQAITQDVVITSLWDPEDRDNIKEIPVAPGDGRSKTIHGDVKLTSWFAGKNFEQVMVNLHAKVDAVGWTAVVSPPVVSFPYASLRFIDIEPMPFNVIVVAQFRAPADQIVTVKVTGEWMTIPTDSSGIAVESFINFMPMDFQDLLLNSLDPMVQVSPGAIVDFKLQVHNRGNDMDDFYLEIFDDQLADNGWSVVLSRSLVENIAPWSYKNVTIRVYTPRKFVPWKNQVTEVFITVSSISASEGSRYEHLSTKDYAFYVYERGVYFPPEQTLCSVTGFIIFIMIIIWIRRYREKKFYRRMEKKEKVDRSKLRLDEDD